MSDEITSASPAIPSILSPEEARVLGCLIEKEITLPDYYPMTLNALVSACNQTTSRDPVMQLDDSTVQRALDSMKGRGYVFQVTIVGARVQKYRHNLKGKLPDLERPQVALLCMLLLRGAQTAGELRQRTERLHAFPDIESVDNTLAELIGYRSGPVIKCLPAGPGRRVAQYLHLFCGDVEPQAIAAPIVSTPASSAAALDDDWKTKIEAEMALMKAQISRLQELVGTVR
ncbi:MAG: YceH family protein [Verrucomicrobiaceae bacterium]|nr:YceH family protein [Verrucomicrobiaceae bacterium]